jgi:hypothetical protein
MGKENKLNLSELLDPRNAPLKISLDEAKCRIENAVYKATDLYERLEGAKLVRGNGHHMRQKIAQMASDLLEERWRKCICETCTYWLGGVCRKKNRSNYSN